MSQPSFSSVEEHRHHHHLEDMQLGSLAETSASINLLHFWYTLEAFSMQSSSHITTYYGILPHFISQIKEMTSPQLPMDSPSECLLPGPHHPCRHSHCVIVFVSVALIVMPFVCMLCPVRSPWLAARWQILQPGKGSQLTKCSGCLWCTVHSSKASSVVLT